MIANNTDVEPRATEAAPETAPETAAAGAAPAIDWADPDIPAGNAPPMPRWRLVASSVVFGLWILFLVAMAYLRFQTTKF